MARQSSLDDPTAPGFTTVEASNGAVLDVSWEARRNIRPWNKSLYIRCLRFLREGDQIEIIFGNQSKGSPGWLIANILRVSLYLSDHCRPVCHARFYRPAKRCKPDHMQWCQVIRSHWKAVSANITPSGRNMFRSVTQRAMTGGAIRQTG